jgi:hypothetical protein
MARTRSVSRSGGGFSGKRRAAPSVGRLAETVAEDGSQDIQYVVGGFGQCGSLADQAIGAFGARIKRRAGHREDFAPLFERIVRRDERA